MFGCAGFQQPASHFPQWELCRLGPHVAARIGRFDGLARTAGQYNRSAEQEFSRVCEAAEGVVALITAVEAQVMGGRAHVAAGLKPRRAVLEVLN